MRKPPNPQRPDGRQPSGGLPFEFADGLPLARGDLHRHAVNNSDRGEARAGPEPYDTGPPGTYEGIVRRYDTHWTGPPGSVVSRWSPPGRNGPEGASPPNRGWPMPCADPRSCALGQMDQVLRMNDPPWPAVHYCEVDAGDTNALRGQPEVAVWQRLTANRVVSGQGWSPPGHNGPRRYVVPGRIRGCGVPGKRCAVEKQNSVRELCDGNKFSRSVSFGTPSCSVIAVQTEELSTISLLS